METKTHLRDETVNALQDLVRINVDSADGFLATADTVKHTAIAALFRDVAAERRGFAEELKQALKTGGQQPEGDGSWEAKAHRWWIGLRSSLSLDDLKVALHEAERGEDRIKGVYEDCMKQSVGNPISDVLHRQYASVKATHDRIRAARDSHDART